jgi:hypothetical protein
MIIGSENIPMKENKIKLEIMNIYRTRLVVNEKFLNFKDSSGSLDIIRIEKRSDNTIRKPGV